MPIYEDFKTDPEVEKNGVIIDYGDFRVTIARAGGANKKFAKVLEAETRPFQRAIQQGSLSIEKQTEIFHRAYSEAIVLNWETKQEDGSFLQGIEGPEGELLPFKKENVILTFKNLPDLFLDLKEQAERVSLFRQSIREERVKN